jgi:hypothetical protein
MSWAGKKNGELLALIAEANFDLFITVDQNLAYQQNLRTAGIAVLVMVAPSNRLDDLLPLMDLVRQSLNGVQRGQNITVGLPPLSSS